MLPVPVHLLYAESSSAQGLGQLCLATKAQLAARDYGLTGGGEDVMAVDADPAIANTHHLQPALHRTVGRVDLLVGGVARPPLPRAVVGKLDPINYAQGSISGKKYTTCSFCRLLTQNGRFWTPMWRLLGQLCAVNWAKGELYSGLLGQTVRTLPSLGSIPT
jgi:hypothetical protein